MSFEFCSRKFVTTVSSRRKLARAVSRNFVTETSFASRNLVTAVSLSIRNLVTVESRNFVTVMSLDSRNLAEDVPKKEITV